MNPENKEVVLKVAMLSRRLVGGLLSWYGVVILVSSILSFIMRDSSTNTSLWGLAWSPAVKQYACFLGIVIAVAYIALGVLTWRGSKQALAIAYALTAALLGSLAWVFLATDNFPRFEVLWLISLLVAITLCWHANELR